MQDGTDREILTVAGREITISNPGKVLFPQAGYTKLDLARYYSPFRMAHFARREEDRTCWCAIRTESTASFSTRSARRNLGPTGSML